MIILMFSIFCLNVKSEYLIFLKNFIYFKIFNLLNGGMSNPNMNTLLVRCFYNIDVLCCKPAIHLNLWLSLIET